MNKVSLKIIVLFFILLNTICLVAQEPWKRFFHSAQYQSFSYQVVETYDGGYLTGGVLKRQDGLWPGWFIKTDINGYVLWQKVISGERESPFWSITKTIDNGFILGGRYDFNGIKYDAYVMKFNACAEPEWCSFLPEADGASSEILNGIYQLPDGSFICERFKIAWEQHNRWSLIKLNNDGTVQWINYYDLNTSWVAQLDFQLSLTSDTGFLITSSVIDTVRPDGAGGEMPLWNRVDNQGNLLWDTKWELPEGKTPAQPRTSFEVGNGSIYSGGLMSPWKFAIIYKLNHQGDTLKSYKVQHPAFSISSQLNTMSVSNDTTFVIGSQFWDSPEGNYWALNITDTLGDVSKQVYEKEQIQFNKSTITSDQKILLVGVTFDYPSHPEMVALYKFNMNLEYDSIYTVPRTYDSLCPYLIVSDTIPMPGICQYVNIPEPLPGGDVIQLKIFPNPAMHYLTIEIPEFSATTTRGNMLSQQQLRPLKGEVQIMFINLAGKKIISEHFDASERNYVTDVSRFSPGMYLVKLTQGNKVVASGKVMVVR